MKAAPEQSRVRGFRTEKKNESFTEKPVGTLSVEQRGNSFEDGG